MSDRLKDFIDNNREAFDSEDPDARLYHNFEQQLRGNGFRPKPARQKFIRLLTAAASVVAVAISLYFIFQKKNISPADNPGSKMDVTSIPDPTYAKQIDQYKQMIDRQQAQLLQVRDEHPDLYRQFTEDINQLDSAYRVLKSTLESNPNTELLLDAMIRNLQFQTALLNRQLSVIKEIKQKSKT